jgi:hypothetical protein
MSTVDNPSQSKNRHQNPEDDCAALRAAQSSCNLKAHQLSVAARSAATLILDGDGSSMAASLGVLVIAIAIIKFSNFFKFFK